MTQLIKCLLGKPEEPSSVPRTHGNARWAQRPPACESGTQEIEVGSFERAGWQACKNSKLQVRQVENSRGIHPVSTLDLHMCACKCTYKYYTYIHIHVLTKGAMILLNEFVML